MRYLFLFSFIVLAHISFAQEQSKFTIPDYKNIEKVTRDKGSPYYYPALMARYKKNDTTLTNAEIHMLYYGTFFNDDEAGSTSNFEYRDSIKAIHKRGKASDKDKKDLIGYYIKSLDSAPFELRTLNALYNLYSDFNDPDARYYGYKMKAIINVIIATGDGGSTKSGFHVNSVSDEYTMLSVFGFDFGDTQSLRDQCDYLEVKANYHDVAGVYFNVEQILAGYRKAINPDDLKKFIEETEKDKK
jgi:hypothetical protein